MAVMPLVMDSRCGPARSSRRPLRGPNHGSPPSTVKWRSVVIDEAGRVANQRFQQRGFAGAVAADQRDFFAAVHGRGKARESLSDRRRISSKLCEFQRMRPGGFRFMSNLMYGRWILERASSEVCKPLDFFLARSGLRGARAGGKSRDEFVQLRDFLFATGVVGFDARANLRLGQHHVVVAAGVHDDRFVVDVRGVRADAVQKMAVVRNDDEHAFVVATDNPAASERNRGRGCWWARRAAAPSGLPKSACASSTRTFWPPCSSPILRSCSRTSDAQAVEQHRGVGFGGVAAFFADDAFEFAEAHAVFVGQFFVRLGVKRVALLQALSRAADCP